VPVGSRRCGAGHEPKLFAEDYLLARQRFQTRLLERGPAPDEAQPLTPPPGAHKDPIQIRSLDLVAWISDDRPIGVLHGQACFLHAEPLWQGHWDLTRPYIEAGYVAMMPALRGENGLPGNFSASTTRQRMCLPRPRLLRVRTRCRPGTPFLAGHSVGGMR